MIQTHLSTPPRHRWRRRFDVQYLDSSRDRRGRRRSPHRQTRESLVHHALRQRRRAGSPGSADQCAASDYEASARGSRHRVHVRAADASSDAACGPRSTRARDPDRNEYRGPSGQSGACRTASRRSRRQGSGAHSSWCPVCPWDHRTRWWCTVSPGWTRYRR